MILKTIQKTRSLLTASFNLWARECSWISMQPAQESSSLHIQQTPPKLAKWLEYLLANSGVLVENIQRIISAVCLKASQQQLEGSYEFSLASVPYGHPMHFWVWGQWDTPPCQASAPLTAKAVSQPVPVDGQSMCVLCSGWKEVAKKAESWACLTCPASPRNSLPCFSVVPTDIKAL